MSVNLGGIVPLSTIDWIGHSAIVIFLRGCPLHCPHCQNQELREGENKVVFHILASRIVSLVKGEMSLERSFVSKSQQINLDEASERARCKPFVDALVLSGGEPLMQGEQCIRLFRLAKSLHLHTGLETSGCYPERLKKLLKENLLDKVFLDVKGPLIEREYIKATGMMGHALRVRESLQASMESGIPLDVRTTIFPEMPNASEIIAIAKTLFELKSEFPKNGLEAMVLQQGRPRDGETTFEPVHLEILNSMAESIADLVNVQVRAASNANGKGR